MNIKNVVGNRSDTNNHSKKFLNQRKFLTVFPFLILPFLALGFYALGGGKLDGSKKAQDAHGLNLQLPGAVSKEDKNADKLSLYEKAKRDSEKLMQQMRNDPYFKNGFDISKV